MCRPDLTIFTHDWVEDRDNEPMPNHGVDHTCVDWNSLEQWVGERKFSLAEGLIRRVDGSVWPDAIEE